MYTHEFEITIAYLRCRPSTFWKTVEKKVVRFHTEKKRRPSEYAPKVVKNLLINALFTSLREKMVN